MTLRPLRPSQSVRRVNDDDDDEAGQASKAGKLAPIIKPVVLPGTKRATCSQCRIRKVRCDGREGLCQNCDRLGFECSFQQSASRLPGRYAIKSPERRRRMQACIPCHLKKTRCYGELPRCSNCVRKARECTYPAPRKQGATPPAAAAAAAAANSDRSSTTPSRETPAQLIPIVEHRSLSPPPERNTSAIEKLSGTSLPDVPTILNHIEDYFEHLYPLPSFAFLHKATVIRRCRDGAINEPLGFAICAVTSLHLQRASLDHHLWAQQAEQLILQHINRPSIFHLQALLLVIRYRIESGEFPTAFMLAALAARTAVALRLNYERSELAFVAQEARRRLFWALYLLDDYFCVGLREFELCPEETIYLQLPCREEIFEAGQQCQTGLLRPSASDNVMAMGLRGAFMRLTSARRAAMRFNRRVGFGEESSSTIGARIRQFEQDFMRMASPIRHATYEAAPSMLLASIRSQDRIAMQAKCLEHAENIIRILGDFLTHHTRLSRGRSRLLLLERDGAVCAFESARLVMFGARLPCATSTLEAAIHKARTVSLHFITEFFPYSASTQTLRTALEHLITSYTKRLAQQTQTAQTTTRETLSEPEPEAPRSSSKISQYANSRQRLSVQSLLLQSDFADDSAEIAGPAITQQQETAYPSFQQTRTDPAGIASELPLPVPSPRTAMTAGTLTIPPATYISTTQQSQPSRTITASPSPWGKTIDARREDAGLIFNPWMGFSGTEEFYGLFEGLSEEY
ncbi:hypothetical protein FHL15_005177 [Xylaria flabelliformis]|uniref:Zn(2)-C6 fungal-type domain-containing protein n=1 Tax=Xylaria flabelliformis TaxID=2512241 RepID=A0A553I0T7_9PEZI|nr:hypothetical protein FHL15_005177 [Xylaria flabelliformis]